MFCFAPFEVFFLGGGRIPETIQVVQKVSVTPPWSQGIDLAKGLWPPPSEIVEVVLTE